jgi:hypothetical protein
LNVEEDKVVADLKGLFWHSHGWPEKKKATKPSTRISDLTFWMISLTVLVTVTGIVTVANTVCVCMCG